MRAWLRRWLGIDQAFTEISDLQHQLWAISLELERRYK